MDGQGAAQPPTGPADTQPTLQDMDVVYAVHTVCPGQVGHIVTALLGTFQTSLNRNELTSRVMLLLSPWQDLANFMDGRILQEHIAGMSPLEILSNITVRTELRASRHSTSDHPATPLGGQRTTTSTDKAPLPQKKTLFSDALTRPASSTSPSFIEDPCSIFM